MAARPDTAHNGKSTRPQARRDDLERYGVWVKAEPQDIAPEPEPESLANGDGADESFLTDEEERLLGSFSDMDTENADSPEIPGSGSGDDAFEILPEIEDFEASITSDLSADSAITAESAEDVEFELSMEDLSAGFEEESISPQTPIDLSTVEGLGERDLSEEFSSLPDIDIPEEVEDFETMPEGASRRHIEAAFSSPELEDVSSEFLGEASPTSPPAEGPSSLRDVTDEFLDLESDPGADHGSKETAETDFEPLDIELHFEDDHAASAPVDHAAAGFEDVGELDGFLDARGKEDFDDLAALEKDLGEVDGGGEVAREPSPHHEAASADPGLANELLLKIANELSSIRSELVTLKSQLATARIVEQALPAATSPELAEEQELTGGFFDEEDDEKIALTGDELDNILSSADFTEESSAEGLGAELGAFPDLEALAPPSLGEAVLDEGILPETGEYGPAEEAVERISIEDEVGKETTPSPAKVEDELIARLADEGISPLTMPPEDTSYLEEPLEEVGLLDMPETPIVEAPLIEPDLSELSIDIGPDEEELEVSDELPVMESEELPDITLGLDAVALPEMAESVLPLEDEPLPEFEEDLSFGDIELATEGSLDGLPPIEEDLVEELTDIGGESPAFEEVLHHEDLSFESPLEPEQEAFDLPVEEAIEGIELDSELFVPSPASEGVDDILLSALREEEASEELILEEETEPLVEEVEPFAEEVPLEEVVIPEMPAEAAQEKAQPSLAPPLAAAAGAGDPNEKLKSDIRSVLSYLDRLLESLPEEKIEEFAHSEHFDTYKKLFEELGLV